MPKKKYSMVASGGFSCPRAQKEAGVLPRGVPPGSAHGRQLCYEVVSTLLRGLES